MLENNKCEACRIGAPKVTDEEKKTFLKELPDWNILDDGVEKLIKDNFDLSPRGIREMLGLNKPIYEKTAAYGHFGRIPESDGSFSWEKTDKSGVFSK